MSADRLERLKQLRDLLASSLAETPPAQRAPLAAQYRATLADIEGLASSSQKGDPVDDLEARRAARGAVGTPRASGAGRRPG